MSFTDKDIKILKMSVLHINVCISKNMSIEDATKFLNESNPSGTENGWSFVEELGKIQCEVHFSKHHIVFRA